VGRCLVVASGVPLVRSCSVWYTRRLMPSRFPFTSFPAGWFRVASSADLKPGEVRPLHYFGRDLVIFRGQDGAAHVLDAHCAHLGAHLGLGGRVEGNNLVCPFHHWTYDGGGACVAVPYATKLPDAHVPCWPVREVNGHVMVWKSIDGEPPSWEFPEMPEFRASDWTPFHPGKSWRIRTHIQELGENGMD